MSIRRMFSTGLLTAMYGLVVACSAPVPEGTLAQAPEPVMALRAALPPSAGTALAALESSPRHGEWVDVALPRSETPISTWIVYPERSNNAPLVIVIHEIFGLTDWVRGVADQLAAEGFIAFAPDLLSGMGPDSGGTDSVGSRDEVVALIRTLEPAERTRRLNAVRTYALSIPAGYGQIGVVGFCWGGSSSFAYAVAQPELDAAVVYYGTAPAEASDYGMFNAPILGHYGSDDQRVNATIQTAEEMMAALGKSYEPIIYEAVGHGFLRAQEDRDGANLRATEQAWPRTLAFFREHLGS